MSMAEVPEAKAAPSLCEDQRVVPGTTAERREVIAGMFIVIGICWPFLFSSVWSSPPWLFPPFAILAGFMRWRSYPRTILPLLPLWGFVLMLVIFTIYGFAVDPMTPYGADKLLRFVLLGAAGYLGACRQKPLTEPLTRGMRVMLFITFVFSVLIAYKNRELFFNAEAEGVTALRQAFSITAFPLVLAMGAACMVPRKLEPIRLLFSGALLLGGAAMEIFVRGRFDAMMLVVLAAMVVLGPPFKHLLIKLPLTVLLLGLAMVIYIFVLPQMGDSFLYMSWMNPESLGGRSDLYSTAIRGFSAFPFGQGIGSFARVQPFMNYPHNIILESAYELGIFGLLCMLGIYLLVFLRVFQYWLSPPHRILGAVLLLLFCQMCKAGDFAMLAFQWVYLYLLLVTTPLDRSWQLCKGKAVE